MIRDITADDIPWIASLCQRRYGFAEYDVGGGLIALGEAMRSPNAVAWRNAHGFLVGNIQIRIWAPKHRSLHILALCVEEGHHWDAVELLRASVAWAGRQGCDQWWLSGSESEHRIGPLAKRVGARLSAVYVIDLAKEAT